MKRITTLGYVAFFTALAFVFFGITRQAYFHNGFFQRNHIVLGFISLAIAAVIFAANYHPGKKK